MTAKKQKLIKIKKLLKKKRRAKAKVDEEATKAKNNIDQSTTNNDVDQAKTDGASAITKIQPDVVKKSEAKRANDDEVIAKRLKLIKIKKQLKKKKMQLKRK